MKTLFFKNWKHAIAFIGLFLLLTSGLYAATPQYVRVSGITSPLAANGIYVKQAGTTGYDPNWEYWKHETAAYYIYARKYGGTEYFWNINASIANTDVNDDNAIFFSDGAHGVEFLATFPSPHQVLNWAPLNGTETPGGCIVEEYTGVSTPEISIDGNSVAIADNSSSTSFSNHTKFGSQNFSSGSVTRTYTISNSGTANLTITNAALSGTNSNQFSITQPLSLTVVASGSTTFTVTFDPSSAGIKNATVTVNNTDSDEGVYDFAIEGYGYTPGDLVVSGITGTYSAANTGYIHQGVSNGYEYWKSANNYYIYNDGTNWYVDNDQNTSSVLFFAANNQTSPSILNVTSWTAEAGAGPAVVSAAVAIADINVKGNSTTITINDITPSFLDYSKYGSVDISAGSRTRTYTIENTGGALLTSLAVTLEGTDAADFSKTDPSSTVAAFGSTTFTVTFDPSSVGTKTATVSIASNDPDENPYVFSISGDAFTPKILIVSNITTPLAANGRYNYLGIINEFQYWKHETLNYYIFNDEYSNQRWWNIDVDTDDSDLDYLFLKTSEAEAPVGLTGWSNNTSPVSAGSPTIVYASPEINIQGNGTTIVDGDVTPDAADHTNFGNVNVSGGTVVRTFTIENTGTATLTLTGSSPYVSISGTNSGDFSVTAIPSSSIAASGSTTFQITFDPSGTGTRSAALSIANDDADENPYNFSIQGTGISAPSLTTAAASSVATTSATLGGNVTSDGGVTVTDRGIVYSTTDATPTIGEGGVTQDANGSGTGTFNESIGSLSIGTHYYYQAYAINTVGTSYGGVQEFTTQNTVSSIVRANSNPTNATSVDWTVTFAAPLTGLTSSNFDFTKISGGISGYSYTGLSGSGTTWTYTANTGSGSGEIRLNLINSTGLSTVLSNTTFNGEVYSIDKIAPTVTITLNDYQLISGETTTVTFTFSEAVTGFTLADLTIQNGDIPSLNSSDGGITFTGTFTPSTGIEDVTNIITLNNTGVIDIAGNPGSGTTNSANYTVDTRAPYVTNIASTKADGTYGIGEAITITVTFSETVNVTNFPQMELETGPVDRVIDYATGTGTSTLNFTYTTLSGDESADLDYKASNSLTLHGGTIKDVPGNDATLTLPTPGAANSLGASKALVIQAFPLVTLGVSPSSISENGGTSTITATLSQTSSQDVTVNLGYTGTATGGGTDYSAAASITVSAGSLSNSITMTGIEDAIAEGNETAIIDITSVSKGIESGTQQATVTITDNDLYTWTGNNSSNWSDAGNWNPASVPNSSIDALIPFTGITNFPIVDAAYPASGSPATCNNLTISSGATLTIGAGNALTVSGTTHINGPQCLVIKSDVTGTASFIDNGISTSKAIYSAKIEKYLAGTNYYYLGIPVTTANSGLFSAAGANRLWSHTESTGNYSEITDDVTPLNPYQGYVAKLTGTSTINFIGIPNTGDHTFSSSLTGTSAFEGYNLICNPYPSALNIDAATSDASDMETTIWYRSGGQFSTYNWSTHSGTGTPTGQKYIPAMQAFWVKVSSGKTSGTINIQNADRLHSAQDFYKKESETNIFRMNVSDGTLTDDIIVSFYTNAADVFENYDSRKMFSTDDNYPQLFSLTSDNVNVVINSYPELDINEERVVSLGFKTGVAGSFTLNATNMNDFYPSIPLYLEDVQQGVLQDLRQTASYTFSSAVVNDINRFKLHFGNMITSVPSFTETQASVYASDNIIYVFTPKIATIEVYDMLGNLIMNQKSILGLNKLLLNISGIYMVKVQTETQITTKKIMISK
jgi:hypothetical protein